MIKKLKKIHIYVGILSSLFLLNITITGILLDLGKDSFFLKTKISSPWLLKWYNLQLKEKAYGQFINDKLIFQWGNLLKVGTNEFFINERYLGIINKSIIAIVFPKAVYLFNQKLEFLEKLDKLTLPINNKIIDIGYKKKQIFIKTDIAIYLVDKDWQYFEKQKKNILFIKKYSQELSKQGYEKAKKLFVSLDLSIYRVISDLHTGAFFYKIGYFFNRFAAFSLIYLIISGLIIWYQKSYKKIKDKRKKKYKKKKKHKGN